MDDSANSTALGVFIFRAEGNVLLAEAVEAVGHVGGEVTDGGAGEAGGLMKPKPDEAI